MQTALSGAVEIPAYILTWFLLTTTLGRKLTLCGFMISGGGALMALLVFSGFQWLVNALALFCKLCIAASFSVAYIHSSEIFPTTIRNGGMGIVSVAARIGGVVAPFLGKTKYLHPEPWI